MENWHCTLLCPLDPRPTIQYSTVLCWRSPDSGVEWLSTRHYCTALYSPVSKHQKDHKAGKDDSGSTTYFVCGSIIILFYFILFYFSRKGRVTEVKNPKGPLLFFASNVKF